MRLAILTFILAYATTINAEDYKAAIKNLELQISAEKTDDASKLYLQLAIAQAKDQELEKAFKSYLKALMFAKTEHKIHPTEEESVLYNQALDVYLKNHSGPSLKEASEKIIQTFGPQIQKHPDYHYLNFIVSAAYANLGKMQNFFEGFYQSYIYYPDSFMALRTQAILHRKIYEMAGSLSEKQPEKAAIFDFAVKASAANSSDTELYKLIITMASDKEKEAVVQQTLNKIMDNNIIVPRSDILFYVSMALETNQKKLAQQFVNKSHQWYQYSRIINEAQLAIDKS